MIERGDVVMYNNIEYRVLYVNTERGIIELIDELGNEFDALGYLVTIKGEVHVNSSM